MKTAAVILTAGSMKNGVNPMYIVGRETVILTMIRDLKSLNINPIVVVLGDRADILENYLSDKEVEIVVNDDYNKGRMISSVKCGLKKLEERCDRALVIRGDVPAFSKETVEKLFEADEKFVRPKYKEKTGHPLLIRNDVFDKIIRSVEDEGLRDIAERNGGFFDVEVDDEGIVVVNDNIDNFNIIKKLKSTEELTDFSYRASVEVSLVNETSFFTYESALLLSLIGRTESIRTACDCLHISYSKAWTMIKNIEKQAGIKFVNKTLGGNKGGNTVLTKQGELFVKEYFEMTDSAQKMINEYFSNNFIELIKRLREENKS